MLSCEMALPALVGNEVADAMLPSSSSFESMLATCDPDFDWARRSIGCGRAARLLIRRMLTRLLPTTTGCNEACCSSQGCCMLMSEDILPARHDVKADFAPRACLRFNLSWRASAELLQPQLLRRCPSYSTQPVCA